MLLEYHSPFSMSRLFPVFTGKTAASRFLFPAPSLLFVKPSPGKRQSSNPVWAILFRNDSLSFVQLRKVHLLLRGRLRESRPYGKETPTEIFSHSKKDHDCSWSSLSVNQSALNGSRAMALALLIARLILR